MRKFLLIAPFILFGLSGLAQAAPIRDRDIRDDRGYKNTYDDGRLSYDWERTYFRDGNDWFYKWAWFYDHDHERRHHEYSYDARGDINRDIVAFAPSDPSPTPLPGSVILFGSAFIALAAFGARGTVKKT